MGAAARTHERVSCLIDDIYLAAIDSSRWQTFLEGLVDATGSRSARMLVLNERADTVTSSLKVNIDDADHRAYVDYYVNACPWRPELTAKPGGRLYSTYLEFSCRQSQFYRTEFFNDWAGPQDIHHGICGTVYADRRQTVQLLVQRTEGQGHYTRHDAAAVNSLVPHLQRAVVLSREAAHARSRAEAVASAAVSRALPFLLLDEHGQVEHATPDALALIDASGQLELRERRLRARRAAADARLGHLVASAADSAHAGWSSAGGTMSLPREGAPGLTLLVTPMYPEASDFAFAAQRAFAAVFIHDPAAHIDVDVQMLATLHGLTAAEARVTAGVALGMDPATVASSLGVSPHTVRSQLKSVFRKTGVARQTELARLVLTGPACRRAPPEPLVLDGVGAAAD